MGRILMVDNLRRRAFTLVNWFCLCKNKKIINEETVNHILIHYEYTCDFWHFSQLIQDFVDYA